LKPPLFRPEAAAEVEDAFRWYERQRHGLGGEFLDAVRDCLEAVIDRPEAYAAVHRDTRRALLRRFPYGLFYRLLGDQMVVIACFHARRDPKVWRRRR